MPPVPLPKHGLPVAGFSISLRTTKSPSSNTIALPTRAMAFVLSSADVGPPRPINYRSKNKMADKRKEPDTEAADQQPFKRTASMALVVAATAPSNSQIVEHRGGNGLKVSGGWMRSFV